MKQIKVYITPEQWAEKRLQLAPSFQLENIDGIIEACGFELIEPETKPETTSNIYLPLFNHLQEQYGIVALGSEMDEIIHLCRPIIAEIDKPESQIELTTNGQNTDVDDKDVVNIPTDEVEAVKYFLNQMPDGYRERALSQMSENFIAAMPAPKDMKDAIDAFNLWAKTKEGEEFWDKVFMHYKSIVPLPPLPNE